MRTLTTLLGMGLCVVGASSVVWAQGGGPIAVSACPACHSAATAASGAPPFPTLDGQHAAYLDKQLREYKSGKRKTSPIMAPVIAALKKQQISVMAAHFAGQTPVRGKVENPELATRGRVLYEEGNRTTAIRACVGCHQANGVGHEKYPRLAGQRQAYTVQQLTEFKSGARSNDRAHVMRALAARLTDNEIKAVAEYLAGLQ